MVSAHRTPSGRHRFSGRFAAAGYLIGIGLGGFFDGILLHQVLQWHHLLSLVDNPAIQDIRMQSTPQKYKCTDALHSKFWNSSGLVRFHPA